MNGDWEILDSDRELFQRELHSFVPDRIFDAHCHLYERAQFPADAPALIASGPERAGIDVFRQKMDQVHPADGVTGFSLATRIPRSIWMRPIGSSLARSPINGPAVRKC